MNQSRSTIVGRAWPSRLRAVEFLRMAVATDGLTIGTICHSLWLFCAAPDLLRGRRVTGAYSILADIVNAGGIYVYDGDMGADTCVDGNLCPPDTRWSWIHSSICS